jgi:hypothetical protein
MKQVAAIKAGTDAAKDAKASLGHGTIFHSILDSKLPDEEKTVTRLTDDA